MYSVNERLLLTLHKCAHRNRILDATILFIARFFIFFLVAGFFIIMGVAQPEALPFATLEFVVAFVVSLLFSVLIGYWYHMERPCERSDVKALFKPFHHGKTFPSDHTTVIFVCAGLLALWGMPIFSLVMIVCGLLVGAARVIAGVHYPVDIFGGALWGWFVGVLVGMLGQWFT